MSTLRCNAIQDTNGVERYLARAWVNFNGTGTVAIRASGNVSSITDNGTSDYTVNFTTAMPDANYAASQFYGDAIANGGFGMLGNGITQTASSYRFNGARNNTGVLYDTPTVFVTVFR